MPPTPRSRRRPREGIDELEVSGYKSIAEPTSIKIRPLTLLAGANSSGKSSVVQPLLLLKQTLEASYDPGPLLLYGPNVRFTAIDQLLSRYRGSKQADQFHIGIGVGPARLSTTFRRGRKKRLEVSQLVWETPDGAVTLRPGMEPNAIFAALPPRQQSVYQRFFEDTPAGFEAWRIVRNRSFLQVASGTADDEFGFVPSISFSEPATEYIRGVIHLPGLRGNPERTYPLTAVGPTYPGTFEAYVASVVSQWQDESSPHLQSLGEDLKKLGLTWKVTAIPVSDTQVELRVGRLPEAAQGGAWDLVNIVDVGFGLSQTLPVLVALRAAEPRHLLYLEQPEIHLHPRAQFLMAEVLADAVKRGVRLVVETHSSLLLLGVQTLVARGDLSPESVQLYWFTRRREDGFTEVSGAELDEAGSFGEWPEDFGEVILGAENDYLSAAEEKLRVAAQVES